MLMVNVVIVVLVALNSVVLLVLLRRKSPASPPPPPPTPPQPQLTAETRETLERTAAETFEAAIHLATNKFGKDLAATSEQLNGLIMKLTTEIVERELGDYKREIEGARAKAVTALGKLEQETLAHQQELQRDLQADITKRRQELLARIDQRLGEAAVAYIVESLGQNADVGAQKAWILDSLERHKADLKKDLADD